MLKILYNDNQVLIAQSYGFDEHSHSEGYGYNLALHVGDEPHEVLIRRAKLLELLNEYTQVNHIVWLNQVHGACVAKATYCQSLQNADALIGDESAVALAIMTADCVPIALFDDDGQIACIHAGWQGLVAGVIAQTVSAMRAPQAYIGAAIGRDNYEMPQTLAYQIVCQCVQKDLVVGDVDEIFAQVCQLTDKADKVLFDVVTLAHLQLSKCCARPINSAFDVACSYADNRLYSHRRATHEHKTATGRMAMLIVKKTNRCQYPKHQMT